MATFIRSRCAEGNGAAANIYQRFSVIAGIVCALWLGGASAHDASDSLGEDPSATDVFRLSCFNNQGNPSGEPYQLFFEVSSDLKSSPPVSAQILNGGKAYSTTDHAGGDGAYSPELTIVRDGSDEYLILVNKSGPGVANYALEYHCESSNGAHTGTADLEYLQLQ